MITNKQKILVVLSMALIWVGFYLHMQGDETGIPVMIINAVVFLYWSIKETP